MGTKRWIGGALGLAWMAWMVCGGLPTAVAEGPPASPVAPPTGDATNHRLLAEVVALERPRILRKAALYSVEPPVTITAQACPRSAGGAPDFFAEADYMWPDPENPTGPYKARDGQTNPDNFVAHRHAMVRLSEIMGTLGSAYLLTGDEQYVRPAVVHLKAWFVDSATRMTPHLLYGQAVRGKETGRSIGIIDTIHLIEVARAAELMQGSPAFPAADCAQVKQWFRAYLDWLTSHPYGKKERINGNNHEVCWAMQAAAFARLVGDEGVLESIRSDFKTRMLPLQMAPDGSFPRELRRTKPYGYSLFVMDAMAGVAQIASTPTDNLWTYSLADGRSMRRGMDFLVPFIEDKTRWPGRQDIAHWNDWPVRQPCLVLAGVQLQEPAYTRIWERLEADPQDTEVRRNLPLRHPLLWLLPAPTPR